jgi:hypothetical protein
MREPAPLTVTSWTTLWSSTLAIVLLPTPVKAQRVFERGSSVIYIDSSGKQVSLGTGLSPQLKRDGKVALIRGRAFGYGDPFDCRQRDRKNWIAIYDPQTRSDRVLFDRALSFGLKGMAFCIFRQMQLSPDNSILYLVSPAYATAGSLAIVNLASGSVSYLLGVNSIFVIEEGAHQGELIYERRLLLPGREPGGRSVYYPFVHARPDGSQIKVIGEEPASGMRRVKTYLRRIGAQIRVDGKLIP